MIARGDKGADWLYGEPSPSELAAHGIRFAALYLKRWNPTYISSLHNVGIAVLPIWETTATMMMGGRIAATAHAVTAVAKCREYGIPEPTPIVFAHDTGTMNSSVLAYNIEAHKIVRNEGYGYGGYGGRFYFDQCAQVGVTFDVIWATNALSWLGGRHPQAHIWQGKYLVDGSDKGSYDTIDGVPVDKDVCQRPFTAWLPSQHPHPVPEDDMALPIITNSEGGLGAPHQVKFVLMDDGTLRHLGLPEWEARGSLDGTAWTNTEISAAGVWAPPSSPSQPTHGSAVFSLPSVPGNASFTFELKP